MSARLAAISLFLRFFQKPRLQRVTTPREAREMFERTAARIFRTPQDANVLMDRLSGGDGPIPAAWISRGRPDRRAVVLYLHGGAYAMGSIMTHRHLGAHLAGHAGARVLMPEYRLAPETRWPGAVEDAVAAYSGLLEAGYEPGRIALAGDSAGGGLAFATLLAARNAGLPDPACIVGFSPWVDLTLSTRSLERNARADPLLPASRIEETRDYYVSAADAAAPTASPLLADIADPPPCLIQASRIELLEDEAAQLAEKLRAAGGDVRIEWFATAPHAWHIFVGIAPEADDAVARAGAFIRARIASDEPVE